MTSNPRKAVPGDSIRRTFTARRFNNFDKAANAFLKSRGPNADTNTFETRDNAALRSMYHYQGTTDREIREVVGIDTPAILPGETEDQLPFFHRAGFKGDAPVVGKFGINRDYMEELDLFQVFTGGVVGCKVFVPTNGAWITRADIDPGDKTRLLSAPHGSAQILWKDTGTNQAVDAIVRLGNPETVLLTGKTLTQIDPDTSGTIRIWLDRTTDTGYDLPGCWLDWMHGDQAISADKEVLVAYFPHENTDQGRWRIIGAECEDVAAAGFVPEFGSIHQSGNNQPFSANQTMQKITTFDSQNGGNSGWLAAPDLGENRVVFTGPGWVTAYGAFSFSHNEDDAEARVALFVDGSQVGSGYDYYIKTKLDSVSVTFQSDPIEMDDTLHEIDARFRKTDGDNETIRIHAAQLRIQKLG